MSYCTFSSHIPTNLLLSGLNPRSPIIASTPKAPRRKRHLTNDPADDDQDKCKTPMCLVIAIFWSMFQFWSTNLIGMMVYANNLLFVHSAQPWGTNDASSWLPWKWTNIILRRLSLLIRNARCNLWWDWRHHRTRLGRKGYCKMKNRQKWSKL